MISICIKFRIFVKLSISPKVIQKDKHETFPQKATFNIYFQPVSFKSVRMWKNKKKNNKLFALN